MSKQVLHGVMFMGSAVFPVMMSMLTLVIQGGEAIGDKEFDDSPVVYVLVYGIMSLHLIVTTAIVFLMAFSWYFLVFPLVTTAYSVFGFVLFKVLSDWLELHRDDLNKGNMSKAELLRNMCACVGGIVFCSVAVQIYFVHLGRRRWSMIRNGAYNHEMS